MHSRRLPSLMINRDTGGRLRSDRALSANLLIAGIPLEDHVNPHKLVRSTLTRHSFTHAAGWRVARQHLCFDGQAVNGRVLAARAQEPSVGIADRWLATWRVQIQAVRAAVARSVSPRCAAVPTDASFSARSALKATSEVGTGRPATMVIEADVLPTSPGHGNACGVLGGL